jgi:hypothetical protein
MNNVKQFPPAVNPQAAKAAEADPASASFERILAKIQGQSLEWRERSGYLKALDDVTTIFRGPGVFEDAPPERRLRFIGALFSLATLQDVTVAADIANGSVTWP